MLYTTVPIFVAQKNNHTKSQINNFAQKMFDIDVVEKKVMTGELLA